MLKLQSQLLELIDEEVRKQVKDWNEEEVCRCVQMQAAGVPLFLIEDLM
ncbi:MAG: hypothetical protein U9O78_00415 [Patescibacteria group bacterium]|nr:hypothetical protein [Patescibacteria group bacterium]